MNLNYLKNMLPCENLIKIISDDILAPDLIANAGPNLTYSDSCK